MTVFFLFSSRNTAMYPAFITESIVGSVFRIPKGRSAVISVNRLLVYEQKDDFWL